MKEIGTTYETTAAKKDPALTSCRPLILNVANGWCGPQCGRADRIEKEQGEKHRIHRRYNGAGMYKSPLH